MSDLPPYPEEHTSGWYALEEEALGRARELLHEENGRIGEALALLEYEYRDALPDRFDGRANLVTEHRSDSARRVARKLVGHVEQCWATEILA